jgi:hypothetical protein
VSQYVLTNGFPAPRPPLCRWLQGRACTHWEPGKTSPSPRLTSLATTRLGPGFGITGTSLIVPSEFGSYAKTCPAFAFGKPNPLPIIHSQCLHVGKFPPDIAQFNSFREVIGGPDGGHSRSGNKSPPNKWLIPERVSGYPASQTTSPSIIVSAERAVWISPDGISKMFLSTKIKSASLPGAMDPLSRSANSAKAEPIV